MLYLLLQLIAKDNFHSIGLEVQEVKWGKTSIIIQFGAKVGKDWSNYNFKCYCLRKPGDMAKSRNMKVVQIYSFLVW